MSMTSHNPPGGGTPSKKEDCATVLPSLFRVSPQDYNPVDHGLGFGQGSTQGVYNVYSKCGFHRPQHPEFSRSERRRFNKRGYRGSQGYYSCDNPYQCHYDPEPYFDECPPTYLRDGDKCTKFSTDEYLAKLEDYHPLEMHERLLKPKFVGNLDDTIVDTTDSSNIRDLAKLALVASLLAFIIRMTIVKN